MQNGMISESDYIGKTLDEGFEIAKQSGFNKYRVVEENGKSPIFDLDYDTKRINFGIRNNKIIYCHGG